MHKYADQRGAALILLIGITATLALLSATLVFVILNQQKATASERSKRQSLYAAEAALDSAVQLAKVDKTMSTTAEWLTQTELEAAFAGTFPASAHVDYRVYDNLNPLTETIKNTIKWDQGGPTDPTTPDHMVWVEATVTYKGKKTCTRCLVSQSKEPFAAALPKAVTYSDTGIKLLDQSDIYAVDENGNPDTSGPPYQTSITAGGTWTPSLPASYAEVGRFTMNTTSNLAKTSTQSLGITVNGSVAIGGTVYNSAPGGTVGSFDSVIIQAGKVGYLSDYFDQAAQASLADESQAGGTTGVAPTALPSPWTSTGFTAIDTTTLNTLQSTTSTTAFSTASNLYRNGSLTLSRGTSTTGRTFTFQRLYVSGNLTLTGPVAVNCTDLYVGGTLTINNTTTTTVSDDFGPLYKAGTGAASVSGSVNVTTEAAYFGGALTISNTAAGAPALTDNFGPLYVVGALSVSGNVETNGTTLYSGGNISFTGSTAVKTHRWDRVWANATSSTTTLSGAVQLYSSETILFGNFTISGAGSSTPVKNWLGHLYVEAKPWTTPSTGDINWSGYASVTSRDWRNPTADPLPMWMGEYWSRTGTFADEYGPTWVPGNSTTSIVFGSTGASSVFCPLLCTTEKNQFSGDIDYGSREKPMVFFYMCDNNGIYPQVVNWSGTGTYYGLMVINESTIDITNGSVSQPSIQGAIFAGCPYDPTYTSGLSKSDIVLEDYSTIAYDQTVVGRIATSSLKTTTLVTQTVPGSWQQLPVP